MKNPPTSFVAIYVHANPTTTHPTSFERAVVVVVVVEKKNNSPSRTSVTRLQVDSADVGNTAEGRTTSQG